MIAFAALASVLVVSLVSFAGALTLLMTRRLLDESVSVLVGLAVGALLGDVFLHIIPELYLLSRGSITLSLAFIAGVLVFFVLEKGLHWHHHHAPDHAKCGPHVSGRLVLVSDGMHNFIDGLIIAASYMATIEIGLATTVAVILHEIPQEFGNFGVLLSAGYAKTRALWYNFLSALTAIAGAAVALILGGETSAFTFWLLPITAGGFMYIALSDLVPKLHQEPHTGRSVLQFAAILVGILLMSALAALE